MGRSMLQRKRLNHIRKRKEKQNFEKKEFQKREEMGEKRVQKTAMIFTRQGEGGGLADPAQGLVVE